MSMKIHRVTVKNGCKMCGKDAQIKYKQDGEGPPLMLSVKCDSNCSSGDVVEDKTISRIARGLA
jgi:hypothetical protein